MTFIQAFLIFIISLLLTFPGVLIAYSIFRQRSLTEVFFLGSLIGMVVIIYFQRLLPLNLLPLTLGLEYVLAFFIFVKSRAKAGGQSASRLSRAGNDPLVWVVAVLSFMFFWIGSSGGILPLGNDPMFHVLLVGKTLLTGHPPKDWLPFEAIPVNYATGGHLLVAMVSWISGAAPHVAFKGMFAPLAFLTAGMFYLMGKEIINDRLGAILGTMLWVTAATWGGMESLRSGTLPDMMGLVALLGAIWAIAAEEGARRSGLIGFLFAGLILIHHHSALTGVAVLLAIVATDRISMGKIAGRGREILTGLIVAACLTPFTLGRIVFNALSGEISNTYALAIPEYFLSIWQVAVSMGLWLVLAGLGALWFLLADIRSGKDYLLPAWVMAIMVLFSLFGYFYRALSFGLYGDFYGAFNPSAFIPELTAPLCLAAGSLLGTARSSPKYRVALIITALVAYFGWQIYSKPFMRSADILRGPGLLEFIIYPLAFGTLSIGIINAGDRKKARTIAAALLLLLLSSVGFHSAVKLNVESGQTLPLKDLQDFNSIRASLPPDVLLVNHITLAVDLRQYGWLPYWTWRECTYTPLPPSEAQLDPSVIYKRSWLEPGFQEAMLWSNLEARPVAWVIPAFDQIVNAGIHELYTSESRKVYLYDPGKI